MYYVLSSTLLFLFLVALGAIRTVPAKVTHLATSKAGSLLLVLGLVSTLELRLLSFPLEVLL